NYCIYFFYHFLNYILFSFFLKIFWLRGNILWRMVRRIIRFWWLGWGNINWWFWSISWCWSINWWFWSICRRRNINWWWRCISWWRTINWRFRGISWWRNINRWWRCICRRRCISWLWWFFSCCWCI
ncbi:hypothetical protein Mgra_00002230, partial [Meloidogyne graminicola]